MLRCNMYNLDLGFKPENMTPHDPDPLAPYDTILSSGPTILAP